MFFLCSADTARQPADRRANAVHRQRRRAFFDCIVMPGSATTLPDSDAQPVDGADFDLWYVGVLLMVLSTFFGALGNVCIKQSFNVEASADADSSLTPAARRRARLVSWAFWLLGAPVFTIVLGSAINVANPRLQRQPQLPTAQRPAPSPLLTSLLACFLSYRWPPSPSPRSLCSRRSPRRRSCGTLC